LDKAYTPDNVLLVHKGPHNNLLIFYDATFRLQVHNKRFFLFFLYFPLLNDKSEAYKHALCPTKRPSGMYHVIVWQSHGTGCIPYHLIRFHSIPSGGI